MPTRMIPVVQIDNGLVPMHGRVDAVIEFTGSTAEYDWTVDGYFNGYGLWQWHPFGLGHFCHNPEENVMVILADGRAGVVNPEYLDAALSEMNYERA